MVKKNILVIFLLFLSLLISCAKKNDVSPGPATGSVTINGTVYPTVTIGNQVWTTQNYSGPGGNEVATTTGDQILNGNYYSGTNVTLPAGWRVPTRGDFNALLANYSSVVNTSGDVLCGLAATEGLISKTGWSGITGTDITGFNAYSAGYLTISLGFNANQTTDKTNAAYYLTSTQFTDPSSPVPGLNNYVEKFGNSPINFDNVPYYSYMTDLTPDLFGTNYASLRFVKDK